MLFVAAKRASVGKMMPLVLRSTPSPMMLLNPHANNCEEKDIVGVGQAQLWNPIPVPKQPAFAAACEGRLLDGHFGRHG